MRWTELRGAVAVAVAVVAIALAWTSIENRSADDDTTTVVTTTTTTTTTTPPSTTQGQDEANRLICERAARLVDDVAEIPPGAGFGPTAVLALEFWQEVHPLASVGARAEIDGVITYYQDFMETAEPFGYDIARIIVEGDKEKLQQLITRPAPGFDGARALIGFGCGIETPEQPRIDAESFEDLEDRLLDDD